MPDFEEKFVPKHFFQARLTLSAAGNKIGTYSAIGIVSYILGSADVSAIGCHDDIDLFEECLVRDLVAAYGRDAIAALRAVIEDATFEQNELPTAPGILSSFFAQGWQPHFQREA
ncbi:MULTISPECIES: hypothetical protein [Rhizobium]|uniref:Uncharacterized protein n=1 Tax=Rhizobium rhododendri TaxID=2506430 RepID=A0ABY8IQ11_9HYPH|nr:MULTISPECIES: hypothetical protein [Rhizobium]MBO9102406.1 hypothetical protein [Rhizobium sp. L58/93]MBO9171733.1 hypothetical protein [Rhizobium sp. L245/93]MBO9182694.1 hypothetical protein [Rhizobium sp. E27B/91]QXZ86450.1 hypothetical protein J5287_25825 [Rhizobium sp. K1/93]QXZ92095.1 hypothetical protein J5280_23360 [Rhizobium sp. K15/93]